MVGRKLGGGVWARKIGGRHGGKRRGDGVHRRDVSIVRVYDVVVGGADVMGVGRGLVITRGELEGVEVAKTEARVGL